MREPLRSNLLRQLQNERPPRFHFDAFPPELQFWVDASVEKEWGSGIGAFSVKGGDGGMM